MKKSDLIDIILDSKDDEMSVFIQKIENAISELNAFHHDAENVKKACGIQNKQLDLNKKLANVTKVSKQVEIIEKTMSKRDLAFSLALFFKK